MIVFIAYKWLTYRMAAKMIPGINQVELQEVSVIEPSAPPEELHRESNASLPSNDALPHEHYNLTAHMQHSYRSETPPTVSTGLDSRSRTNGTMGFRSVNIICTRIDVPT